MTLDEIQKALVEAGLKLDLAEKQGPKDTTYWKSPQVGFTVWSDREIVARIEGLPTVNINSRLVGYEAVDPDAELRRGLLLVRSSIEKRIQELEATAASLRLLII